ncbi:MAG: restriction endonuclease subunit S [Mucilaginibacter polytrichastri]|nr:restriction endonuclease subunit S [Mucilaginibacter polytrichastri]
MSDEKDLVPRLRFPEFQNQKAWEDKTLLDVCDITNGKSNAQDHIVDGLYPLFDRSAVIKASNSFLFDCEAVIIPGEGMRFVPKYYTGKFDLHQRAYALINFNCNGLFVYFSVVCNSNLLSIKAVQSTVLSLRLPILQSFQIQIPHDELEQQKIADCLSSLDELIAAHTEKLTALKTYKKGLMQQLVPAEGETVPKLRFKEFEGSGDWEIRPLSKLIKSLDAGVSVNSGDRPAIENEVGILKTSCVTNDFFEPIENKVVYERAEKDRLREPVTGDTIIISRMNTPALVGANAYVQTGLNNIFLPDRLWAAKAKLGTNMKFVAHVLGSKNGRKALSELASGTSGSMKNIAKSDVLDMRIAIPNFLEQQKIADCLSSLDNLITKQTENIAALKGHKKGLMQGLFPAVN